MWLCVMLCTWLISSMPLLGNSKTSSLGWTAVVMVQWWTKWGLRLMGSLLPFERLPAHTHHSAPHPSTQQEFQEGDTAEEFLFAFTKQEVLKTKKRSLLVLSTISLPHFCGSIQGIYTFKEKNKQREGQKKSH